VEDFARAIAAAKPRFRRKALRVPLAMILFGMINWTFTWLRAQGPLTYADMADIVTEIFLHGAVESAPVSRAAVRARVLAARMHHSPPLTRRGGAKRRGGVV